MMYLLLLLIFGDDTPIDMRKPLDLHIDDGTFEVFESLVDALRRGLFLLLQLIDIYAYARGLDIRYNRLKRPSVRVARSWNSPHPVS